VLDIAQLKERFRTLRIQSGLTQQEFAAKAGFDYKFYQYLESPRKKQIWLETIDRIAAGHGLECWQLLHPECSKFLKSVKK
jgi:transcriptional regulator with XRE-family HTH domain